MAARSSKCKACGTRTTASAGYCQSCKSTRHHGYKRIKEENLLVDEAGGAWWIWNQRGDVIVSGKPTRDAAIIALGTGEDDVENDDSATHERHAAKKTATQLDAEIAEALASRQHTTKRRSTPKHDSKIVIIEGEPWRVERKRFWLPDTGGGTLDRAWNFVRVSDGRAMTSGDKEQGLRIIAERIRDGTYAGPPLYHGK